MPTTSPSARSSPTWKARASDGYLVKAAIFDLDGDGAAEHLGSTDQGTMGIERYSVIKPDGTTSP